MLAMDLHFSLAERPVESSEILVLGLSSVRRSLYEDVKLSIQASSLWRSLSMSSFKTFSAMDVRSVIILLDKTISIMIKYYHVQ
jgi:hypothetical protein